MNTWIGVSWKYKSRPSNYQSDDPPMLLAPQTGSFSLQHLDLWRTEKEGNFYIKQKLSSMHALWQYMQIIIIIACPEHTNLADL